MEQPWFGDSIVLVGGSYLGYVQWAVADALPPQVKAMIPQITESALTLEFLRKDGMSLETPFGWGVMVARPGTSAGRCCGSSFRSGRIRRALTTLPLDRADVAALGHRCRLHPGHPRPRRRRPNAGRVSTTGTGWPG